MKGEEQNPGGIFGSVFDFLKIFGASLTGVSAILTAAGFLAERARLTMLGLPSSTFDLEQYIETGALLLALLPVVMGIALLLILVSWVKALPGGLLAAAVSPAFGTMLLLAGGGAVLLYLIARRGTAPNAAVRWAQRRLRTGRRWINRYGFGILLAAALIVQVSSLNREVQVLELRDLLFRDEVAAVVEGDASSGPSFSESDEIEAAVADGRETGSRAVRLFGQMVLLAAVNGLVLYYVFSKGLSSARSLRRRRVLTGWAVVTTLLLISQVTLLPVSYGVLLSQNYYPEVCVSLSGDGIAEGEQLPDSRLALVHHSSDGFYFYSRQVRKMWYVPRNEVQSVVHHARTNILDPGEPASCRADEPS